MSELVSYNYHGRSSEKYFGSHKRKKNHYYDKQFMGQSPFIPHPFRIQSYYPTYFYPNNGYPTIDHSQFGQSNMTMDLMSFNQSNEQYRYAQYIRDINTMQNRYWEREASSMPLVPSYRCQTSGFDGAKLGFGYPSIADPIGRLTMIVAPTDRPMGFPPNIRVIFMPTGLPSSQQSCIGALSMPPFLFNRMPQVLCSLPLPPPLPQMSLLPLSLAVQQMVVRQYANPVAVLPYTPNCPMACPMISSYSQQPRQSIAPISALDASPSISQSYIPPTLLPLNMPMSPCSAIPSQAPYSNSVYPSTCRACIPPPPSLNTPVRGHGWVQNCSACDLLPTGGTKPNIRSNNGRFTPLLRHPIVKQNAYNPPIQQQQYPDINTSAVTRPWLHEMPPLPQGAIIISDEYVTENKIANTSHISSRIFNSESRSVISSGTNQTKSKRKRRKKPKDDKFQSNTKSNSITPSSISATPVRHRTLSSSSSSSCSLCKATRVKKQRELDVNSQSDQQTVTRSQSVASETYSVNLSYNSQPSDLHTIVNNIHDLKSSDTNSISIASPKYLQVNEHLISPVSIDSIGPEVQNSTSSTPSQLE